jgi:hypothetical protein
MAKKATKPQAPKAKAERKETSAKEVSTNELPITRVIKQGASYIVHRGDGHSYSSEIVSENPLENED